MAESQQLLAEVVVDRGVGAAAGGAGQGDGRGARPVAPHSSSGLAPTKAASGVPQQKQKQDGKGRAQRPEEGRRRRGRGAPSTVDLAGEDDLLAAAGADPLDGRGDARS